MVELGLIKKLSIVLNKHENILIDQNNEFVNEKNIRKKINILKSFNNQYQDTLEIKEIDLTWKGKIFIKSI